MAKPESGEIAGRSWSRVTRTGVSPMNPRVKWADLECGHMAYGPRRPRLGSLVVCDRCSAMTEQEKPLKP